MSDTTITDARAKLAALVDEAREKPVYLTRRDRPVAAIIGADLLRELLENSEELEDIRAVDAAWAETQELAETPIPWEQAKRDLGLV